MVILLLLYFLLFPAPARAVFLYVEELQDIVHGNPVPSVGTGAEGFYFEARDSFAAADAEVPIPIAGTLKSFSFQIDPHEATCTMTAVVRINSAGTALTCALSNAGRQTCAVMSTLLSVAAGDTLNLVITASGAGCVARSGGAAGSGRQPLVQIELLPAL